jgi:hypothetical protein
MHVKTLSEYKKHNAEELLTGLTSACDENIRIFMEKVKMSGKPVKREITSIYRLKQGNKEHFTYHQKLSSQDSLDNYIECWYPGIGKWSKPTFSTITNPETGAKIADGIRSTETIYELEWPKDWTPELEADVVNDISNLVVIAGSLHYGGYTFDDFKNRSFDELVTFGRYGTFTPTTKIIEIEDNRRAEKDKEKRNR